MNPCNTCVQGKEQHRFFLGLKASSPDKPNNDDDEKDSHSDIPPSKRCHRNKKSDQTSSSSSEDDLASDLKRINDEKDEKLNKDVTIAANAPFSLGLKYLTTDEIARAPANETAMLLRAMEPVTATLTCGIKKQQVA